MKKFQSTHRIAYSAEQMFALVADIERYPEFLPLCKALVIRSRGENGQGQEQLTADMTVAYKMFQESFTSRVTLLPDIPQVLVEYVDGPFRHLENRWTFKRAGDFCCDIDFFIEYEFASTAMQLLVGSVFEKAFRKFVGAFEERAGQVYGASA